MTVEIPVLEIQTLSKGLIFVSQSFPYSCKHKILQGKICKNLVVVKNFLHVVFLSYSVTFAHQNFVLQYDLGLMRGFQTMAFQTS